VPLPRTPEAVSRVLSRRESRDGGYARPLAVTRFTIRDSAGET